MSFAQASTYFERLLGITHDEFIASVIALSIGILWNTFTIPALQPSSWYQGQNPVYQFVLYNTGYFFMITGLVGYSVGLMAESGNRFSRIVKGGIVSFLFFDFVIDLYQFNISAATGSFTIGMPPSQDEIAAYVWLQVNSNLPNLTKFCFVACYNTLYLTTYLLTPIVVILLSLLTLRPSLITNQFSRA